MPEVWTSIPLDEVLGAQSPQVTRDPTIQRISTITIQSPYVKATATITRDATPAHSMTAVTWSLQDV